MSSCVAKTAGYMIWELTLAATTAKGASSRFRILLVILGLGVRRCKLKRVSRGSSSYIHLYTYA